MGISTSSSKSSQPPIHGSGPAEVVATESLMSYKGHPIWVKIPKIGFEFKVEAIEDTNDDAHIAMQTIASQGFVSFELVNFRVTAGGGTQDPVRIGTVPDKAGGTLSIFMHIRTFFWPGNTDFLLHYTVYLVKE